MAKGKKEDLIHLLHELSANNQSDNSDFLPLCHFWVACSVSQAHKDWSQSFLFKDFLKISTTQRSNKSCAIPLYAPGVDGGGGNLRDGC